MKFLRTYEFYLSQVTLPNLFQYQNLAIFTSWCLFPYSPIRVYSLYTQIVFRISRISHNPKQMIFRVYALDSFKFMCLLLLGTTSRVILKLKFYSDIAEVCGCSFATIFHYLNCQLVSTAPSNIFFSMHLIENLNYDLIRFVLFYIKTWYVIDIYIL